MYQIADRAGVRSAIQALYRDTMATLTQLPKGDTARNLLSRKARRLKKAINSWGAQ